MGCEADIYKDDEEVLESTDRSRSPKWYNDKSIETVDVETYFGTREFVPEEEETVFACNLLTVNWLEDQKNIICMMESGHRWMEVQSVLSQTK